MRTVDAVCLLVFDDDRLLLERRGMHKDTFPGVVVAPGGHVESGESLEEACKKELKEELRLECAKFNFIEMILFPTPIEVQNVHYFVCKDWTGVPPSLEVDEVFFVGLDELEIIDIAEEREFLQSHSK